MDDTDCNFGGNGDVVGDDDRDDCNADNDGGVNNCPGMAGVLLAFSDVYM